MGIERRVQTIDAGGRIDTPRNNFFLILSATGSVNLRAERGGTSEGFNGISGGILVRRIQSWDTMTIEGTPGVSVEYLVGSEHVERDETDIRLQIATIAGVAAIAEEPAATVADTPQVDIADTTQDELVPANLLRKRVTIFVDPDNGGSCFIRTAGGANNIGVLVPGVTYEFKGRYALDVRNDTGGTATFYIFEEA